MPLAEKSRAIVLHTTRQGDNALVVTVLDENAGRCGLFVRGIGRRHGSSAFHSLNVLETVTTSSPCSSLFTLREYSPMFHFDSIRSDMGKSSTALYMCEVLYRCLREGDGDASLFNFVMESAVTLDSVQGSAANFHLWWTVGLCYRLGFRPEDNWHPVDAPCFDMVSARFAPQGTEAEGRSLFRSEESALLHHIMNSTAEEALTIPLSSARRQAFLRKVMEYISYHLGVNPEIRSLDVLHSVFA